MTTTLHPGAALAARAIPWALMAMAAMLGGWASFDFGLRIGDLPMGLVAAFNGALISALMAGMVWDTLARWWPRVKPATR
ncbi:MAG: hypothetical protein U1F56_24800 [Rubrivivax sp.]